MGKKTVWFGNFFKGANKYICLQYAQQYCYILWLGMLIFEIFNSYYIDIMVYNPSKVAFTIANGELKREFTLF